MPTSSNLTKNYIYTKNAKLNLLILIHIVKKYVAAMKVPRLGLQVNYTQDSSRHNDNAETLELDDINTHSEKMRK